VAEVEDLLYDGGGEERNCLGCTRYGTTPRFTVYGSSARAWPEASVMGVGGEPYRDGRSCILPYIRIHPRILSGVSVDKSGQKSRQSQGKVRSIPSQSQIKVRRYRNILTHLVSCIDNLAGKGSGFVRTGKVRQISTCHGCFHVTTGL
jgi:hypothetical protein